MAALDLERSIRVRPGPLAVALSLDGQLAAVGSEHGVQMYNLDGAEVLAWPAPGGAASLAPVAQLVLAPDLSHAWLGMRTGELLRLALQRQDGRWSTVQQRALVTARNDINDVAVYSAGGRAGIGHRAPALTAVDTTGDGTIIWRHHPDDGTATERRVWSVAFAQDGQTVYAGSGVTAANHLLCLSARDGAVRRRQVVRAPITALQTLESGALLAVTAAGPDAMHLAAYTPDLGDPLWERAFDEPITAIAVEPAAGLVALGLGYDGGVLLVGADGRDRSPPLLLRSLVCAVALARGPLIAALTEDRQLVLIRLID